MQKGAVVLRTKHILAEIARKSSQDNLKQNRPKIVNATADSQTFC